MQYKLAVFDMDGTILNTLDDLHAATNHALTVCGHPTRTLDEVRMFVGNGMRKLIERAAPKGSSQEELDRIYDVFTDYYRVHCADFTRPYPGIVELLASLKSAGVLTAVVSNKDDYAVQELVKEYFPGLFDAAVGVHAGAEKKPAPDMVNEILSSLAIDRRDAVYIGDTDVDYATGKNAGMDVLSVTWGFRDIPFLRAHGATDFADTPDEVLKRIIRP